MDAALRREVRNLLRMGESALERKDYDQASFLFRKAFTQDPDNVAAIINLGYTYVKMGRFSHARKCFTTALDIDPENPVARKNLTLLMRPGKTDQYRPKYRSRPEEEIYIRYMQWGNLLMDQKNYYAAIQYFESASTIHPDFIEPFLKMGLSYEELGEYSLACQAFEEALGIYAGDPVAKEHLERCQTFEEQPKPEHKEQEEHKPPSEPVKPVSALIDDELYEEESEPEDTIPAQKPAEPQKPQTEADIVMSILAQYSSDQEEHPAEESSEPVEEPPKPAQSPQIPVDDPVMSILMQYKDEIPEDGTADNEQNQADEQIPQTGAAPLTVTMNDKSINDFRVDLNDNQKDALRELGNIGASHAATTLSTMLNTPIMLNVPEISIVDLRAINEQIEQGLAAMVVFTMEGQMAKAGYVILHVPQESVIQMTSIMLGLPIEPDRPLNEMDESAINEIGNIMVSAFLDGTAELLGIIMLPSPPRTIFDYPKNVFDLVIKESNILYDNVVFFKTELICDEHELSLNIFMLPNPPVLLDIVRMLEKIIEDSAAGI
ncbi:MAG: flagellar motor switch protein [Euryarchaeota archaeon ADurb.Bin294]|nr:MAG: flagellar motor switch protein [Euryarchaeota archaeon ADurb.Bin294]